MGSWGPNISSCWQWRCPGWSESSSLDAMVMLLVLLWVGSNCRYTSRSAAKQSASSSPSEVITMIRQKKKSCFWKPYRPYFFGANSKKNLDIENFSSTFRVFWMIFMLFLYKRKNEKIICLPTESKKYWDVSGNKIFIFFGLDRTKLILNTVLINLVFSGWIP